MLLEMNTLILKIRNLTTNVSTSKPLISFSRALCLKNAITEEELKAVLEKSFPKAKEIQVKDVSGGCGAMFDVYVEAKEFNDLSVMKQHRAVYDALDKQIKQIHGLHILTKPVK